MDSTTTRTGFIHADQEPLINVEVLESLIAWRNWCYWQEQKKRRQQLLDNYHRDLVEVQAEANRP